MRFFVFLVFFTPKTSTIRVKFMAQTWCVHIPNVMKTVEFPWGKWGVDSLSLEISIAWGRPHMTFITWCKLVIVHKLLLVVFVDGF